MWNYDSECWTYEEHEVVCGQDSPFIENLVAFYATELNESGVRKVDRDHYGSAFISFPASNSFCASEQS